MSELRRHVALPSVFETRTVLDVASKAGRFELRERPLDQPYRKDYDALEDPMGWPDRFDVSKWVLLGAYGAGGRIGGAIGAFDTSGVDMLEGRRDLVVLWDIRVSPGARRSGAGSALFHAIEEWARARNCRELKVETQNTNVAACRFYARQGCQLKQVNYRAYPRLPDEVQLIWRKAIR